MEEIIRNNIDFTDVKQQTLQMMKLIFAYNTMAKELFTKGTKDTFTKRIGNTTYRVKVFFDETAMESVADKLMHWVNTEIAAKTWERSIYE